MAIGRVLRRLRHRLGLRQKDVAARADISDTTYSEVERGHLDRVTLAKLRRIAAVLEVELHLEPRWRGGALERALSQRHAEMSEVAARLVSAAGWEVRPEVSFNHFGERGIVDLVAWHAGARSLLLIEIKTELVDVSELLGVTDRRRRLASQIAAPFGWSPAVIGQWIVIAEGRTNRRRVAEHVTVLRAAFPLDGRSVAGWLRRPDQPMSALWFLPDSAEAGRGRGRAPRLRVRHRALSVAGAGKDAEIRSHRNLAVPHLVEVA